MRELMPRPGERLLAVGTTRVGKSTLVDHYVRAFADEHPEAEILIIDSKPRYRAEETVSGFSAAGFYKKWAPGPLVPGSVRVDLRSSAKRQLRQAFGSHRIAIAQTDDLEAEHGSLFAYVRAMYRRADGRRPRVVYVDEGHDHFHPNGYPRPGAESMMQVARAGGEKGVGLWALFQRPKGFPAPLADFAETFDVFQLNSRSDVRHLIEHGWPEDAGSPDTPHVFYHWRRGEGPVLPSRLEVPPHYLAGLSRT